MTRWMIVGAVVVFVLPPVALAVSFCRAWLSGELDSEWSD